MIQRIQSIFLLLAAVCFALLFVFPFAYTTEPQSPIFEDMLFNIKDHIVLLILACGAGLLALINIFLFNNRALQLKLGYILIILSIFLPMTAIWVFYAQTASVVKQYIINDGIGLYIGIIALIAAVLANRFIAKDQKIVKSMDRLR